MDEQTAATRHVDDVRMVSLAIRVAGAVLAFFAIGNAFVAVAVPPKTPIFSPSGRTVLAFMSVAVAALGVALAVGRRWFIWPLIAAVAASLIVTLVALISSEPIRLGQLPHRVVGSLVFTYTNGLIAVATTYGFGLVVLLADELSRHLRAQSAPHPSPPLTRPR